MRKTYITVRLRFVQTLLFHDSDQWVYTLRLVIHIVINYSCGVRTSCIHYESAHEIIIIYVDILMYIAKTFCNYFALLSQLYITEKLPHNLLYYDVGT